MKKFDFKMKKKYMWIGIGVVVLAAVFAFFVFSNNGSDKKDSVQSQNESLPTASDTSVNSDVPVTSDAAVSTADKTVSSSSDNSGTEDADSQNQQVKPKYEDAELYEKDGKKYAKTEDGTEVEFSGENMQTLMEEYMQVQGTGSEREKELLDQMQVILDNADKLAQE